MGFTRCPYPAYSFLLPGGEMRNFKIIIVLFLLLLFSVPVLIWIYQPLIGPIYIKGLRRTPDENIRYIRNCNIVLLSNPTTIIKDKKGNYYDWAYAETVIRAILSSIMWVIMVSVSVLWIYKQKIETSRRQLSD